MELEKYKEQRDKVSSQQFGETLAVYLQQPRKARRGCEAAAASIYLDLSGDVTIYILILSTLVLYIIRTGRTVQGIEL